MKTKISFFLLLSVLLTSSCATVKYDKDVLLNTYTDLTPGKKYALKLSNGKTQKMYYNTMTQDSLIGGWEGKRIALAKKDVRESTNINKSAVRIGAGAIGAAAVTALIITSVRAEK